VRKIGIGAFGAILSLVFEVAPLFGWPVPDTGQTTCYNDVGAVIVCPRPGERFYGQDGNFTINPLSYTKLDGNGNSLPFSATSWSLVRDNVTGLIWEVKTDDGSIHDRDDMYDWYAADKEFIASLNDVRFCRSSDWRLPTIKELTYLVDYNIPYPGPTIRTAYFPHTVGGLYWSSTPHACDPDDAWLNCFYYGYNYRYYTLSHYFVRAVRGGRFQNQFVDNGDGTVSDISTGLMWQQDTVRNGQKNFDAMTWEEALAYCADLELPKGGYTDWRLPTIKELRSITDYDACEPAINRAFFPNTSTTSSYWTSTTMADDPKGALCVGFSVGYDYWVKKSLSRYVRAVRGGQSQSFSHQSIRANNSEGPLFLAEGKPVSIEIALDPGERVGDVADWWIAASTPYDPPINWYSYIFPTGWTPGIHRCIQIGLFELKAFEVLKMQLSKGHYTFYFAIDAPDGVASGLWWGIDSVEVYVQ
jgi:hypothetical protein